jgi:WD40 repeat protein
VKIWDAVTGEPDAASLAAHNRPVSAVAFGRGGYHDLLMGGSGDRPVRIWDLIPDRATRRPLAGH